MEPPRYTDAVSKLEDPLSLVEVRSAGSMGLGLFATQDIAKDTIFLIQTPILSIKGDTLEISMIPGFCDALQSLTPETLKELDSLCSRTYPAKVEKTWRKEIREWHRDNRITDPEGDLPGGNATAVDNTLRRFGIFCTNSAQIQPERVPGQQDDMLHVVYPLYSRINHSCVPNANMVLGAGDPSGTGLCRSLCDIQAGQQIFIAYVQWSSSRKQRAKDLGYWGFKCRCEACVSSPGSTGKRLKQKLRLLKSWRRRGEMET